MGRKFSMLFFCLYFFTSCTFGQNAKKQLPAKRTTATFKIDGNLNETAWKETTPITNLIESRPKFGGIEPYANRTEIYILYDNTSIYVGGYCHENKVDSVSKELIGRDQIGVSDFVGVIFDTYNDKINASGFYVTPYGEQYDAKYSSTSGEDASWNAVWESEAKMQADGWTFEMKIPYSCLRFATKDNQTWGLNIIRRKQKTGQQFSWSPLNPNVSGFVNQEGEWTGIEKIKSPLRLSFSPYLSTYINNYPYNSSDKKNTTTSINGGMDVKYGISQSFTLDMTLVPDFGQVQSDNPILNLSPYEVKYSENRSFFTEGTELFNKGNLFYSRRIGGNPIHQNDVYSWISPTDTITNNPVESKLINATKISGRTSKGLGIGFFNAITTPMYATVEDKQGNNKRKIETNPLTNYNILVLDQSLKNKSSVTLINTNVTRFGHDYDANVSAAVFDFNDKKNRYNAGGKVAVSDLYSENGRPTTGYTHILYFGKTSGKFNFNLHQELTDDSFNPNDLGILFTNNHLYHNVWIGLKWTKPSKWYNNIYVNNNFNYSRRFKPDAYQSFNYNFNVNGQLKNLWYAGFYFEYDAAGNDYYESHLANRFFRTPQNFTFNIWGNTNRAKKYSANFNIVASFNNLFKGNSYDFWYDHTFRFSDKFSVEQSTEINPAFNDVGYGYIPSSDLFSRRNRTTVINFLFAKYNFNKRTGITFRARHYWSKADAKELFSLNPDGSLTSNNPVPASDANQNFNAFNIDMVYTWQFGPGSFVNIVWKNSIYNGNQNVGDNYFKNFRNTIDASQNNNISLKVLYYLDALRFRKKS